MKLWEVRREEQSELEQAIHDQMKCFADTDIDKMDKDGYHSSTYSLFPRTLDYQQLTT